MQCNIVGCHILNIEFLSALIKRVEAAQAQGQFSGAGGACRIGNSCKKEPRHTISHYIAQFHITLQSCLVWSG